MHDPTRQEDRRRAASKAGRSKPSRELAEIKADLRRVIAAVDSGDMERGVGSVQAQLYNVLLRACEIERRVVEADDHLARIEDLEARIGERGVG